MIPVAIDLHIGNDLYMPMLEIPKGKFSYIFMVSSSFPEKERGIYIFVSKGSSEKRAEANFRKIRKTLNIIEEIPSDSGAIVFSIPIPEKFQSDFHKLIIGDWYNLSSEYKEAYEKYNKLPFKDFLEIIEINFSKRLEVM